MHQKLPQKSIKIIKITITYLTYVVMNYVMININLFVQWRFRPKPLGAKRLEKYSFHVLSDKYSFFLRGRGDEKLFLDINIRFLIHLLENALSI